VVYVLLVAEGEFYDYDQEFEETVNAGIDRAIAQLQAKYPDGLTEEQMGRLEDSVQEAVQKAISSMTDGTFDSLQASAPEMLEHRRRAAVEIGEAIESLWGEAFDQYEITLKVAFEIGEFYFNKHAPKDGGHDIVFAALGRLAARACRTAEEVLVPLKAGYGQAALVRWRALHEIDIVSRYLAAHDEEVARRFFDHGAVETWAAIKEFQDHADALGETPYSEQDVATVKANFDLSSRSTARTSLVPRAGPRSRWPGPIPNSSRGGSGSLISKPRAGSITCARTTEWPATESIPTPAASPGARTGCQTSVERCG
jgi:hypothetical protein